MNFVFAHNNFNVLHLEKSLAFYKEALNLVEVRRIEKPDFTLVYLGDGKTAHSLELTWLKERQKPYDLGDNEFHLAVAAEDLPELFSQYRRFDSAQGSEGLGLGLTMVKAVVERHGGRVSCESVVGKGTTFSLQLPLLDD